MVSRDLLFSIKVQDDSADAVASARAAIARLESDIEGLPDIELEVSDTDLGDVQDDFDDLAASGDDATRSIGDEGLLGGLIALPGPARAAGVAVGGAALAVFGLARDAAEAATELGRYSDQTGISVETLDRLRQAAGRTGSDLDELVEGFKTLNERIQAANRGEEGQIELLERLGLNFRALADADPAEVLFAFDDALRRAGDNASVRAAAHEALGGDLRALAELTEGFTVPLRDVAEGITATITQADVERAREYNEQMQELSEVITELGTLVLPVVTEALDSVTTQLGLASDGATALLEGVEKTVDGVGTAVNRLPGILASGFERALGPVRTAINTIIGAYNSIPLVPDIPLLSEGGSSGVDLSGTPASQNIGLNPNADPAAIAAIINAYGGSAGDIRVQIDGETVATANNRQQDRTSRGSGLRGVR